MECVHSYAQTIDGIIRSAFTSRAGEHGGNDGLCVVALGGYGRRELWPFSDIDIMLLYRERSDRAVIKAFERDAWDLGLTLGFSARTLAECAALLGDDCATDTAFLESACIAGSGDLHIRLIDTVVRPYFKRRKRQFLKDLRSTLLDGTASTGDSLYRIEPDVKNGICGLRDCQRIAWAERVGTGTYRGNDRPGSRFVTWADRSRLDACYRSLTKLRIELHMTSQRRLDVLEVGLQPVVAESMGYAGGGPAALMGDFFKTVTTIRQCILACTEQIHDEQSMLRIVRSSFASFSAGKGLRMIDGFLHLEHRNGPHDRTALWIMTVFSTAMRCRAEIGMDLRNRLREVAQLLKPSDFRNSPLEKIMYEILSADHDAGRILGLMHETGVLELLFPEFAPLACKVEFDTYHEFTVDQHTLMALRAMDDLGSDEDPLIRKIWSRIGNHRVLRLALLLHDVGKAIPGDHCRSGTIIARNTAARFGLAAEEQHQVGFLVYHHLDMSELSLHRELEEGTVSQFVETVETRSMLDMLYLLTVLDIRHVGSKTWTGWKAMQLHDIFNRAEKMLARPQMHAKAGTLPGELDGYITETTLEDRHAHEQWLETLGANDMQLHTEPFTGFYRVTIVTFDRTSLLADIAACFIAAGLQIISARAHSLPDGKIIDEFDVEPEDATRLPFDERIARFQKSWELITIGTSTSLQIVTGRLRNYPRKPQRQVRSTPKVTFNNTDSSSCTIVEVHAPDRFGLFYNIVNALSSCNVNINAARISTEMDMASDVLYISDSEGDKIDNPGQLNMVETVILTMLNS
jgi:[protein-PII] uridylyltransferase